jgi:transcriptional regulator of acetoin/glycerol metabolism
MYADWVRVGCEIEAEGASPTKAAEKIARQRLSVLQLAEALGNISEASPRRGMHRSMFYGYPRRFQTHGLEGLKDLPPRRGLRRWS